MSNMIIFKFIFNTSDQLPNETINDYICGLRELAKSCKSGNMTDDMERDRLLGKKQSSKRQHVERSWLNPGQSHHNVYPKRKNPFTASEAVTRTLIPYRLWTYHLKSSSYTSIKVPVETVRKCLSTGYWVYLQRKKLKAVRTKHVNRLPRTETYQEDIKTLQGNLKLELETHSSLRPWNARWSSSEKPENLDVNVVDMNQTHILSAETCENLVTDYQCSPQADNITI